MTSSNNLINRSEQRFRSLALLTVIIVYLVVLAGGIVRGTGSGMGCPDWPRCFGQWIPPTDVSQLPPNYQEIYGAKLKGEVEFNAAKTWIEYLNRLLGVLSGLFVTATLVASLSFLRSNRPVFWSSLTAFLLIGLNGWLGSRVVATELAQHMITLHLLLAILVVLALLYVLVRSHATTWISELQINKTASLNRVLLLTMILSMGQVLLGAQVRDALDEVVNRLGYTQRNNWIDALDWRFYVHRSFSLVVLAMHVFIIYRLQKMAKHGMLSRLVKGLTGVVIAEIITGAIMGYFAVPAVAQPIHLFLAIVMIGLQFVVWLMLNPAFIRQRPTFQRMGTVDV